MAVFIDASIAAGEHRYVMVVDVKQAYLKAKVPDWMVIYVYLERDIATRAVKIKSEWKEFLDEAGGLYARAVKAFYGTPPAGKLWNDDIDATLKAMGFKYNAAELCSYEMSRLDCSISFGLFVDDGKVSSAKKENLLWVLNKLKEKYGEVTCTMGPVCQLIRYAHGLLRTRFLLR